MNSKNVKLSRGESIYINSPLNNASLVAVHWYDKRDVFVFSTIHGTDSVEVCRRGDDTPFPKPIMIDEYNHYMGGVDKLYQLISTYSFTKEVVEKSFLSFTRNFSYQHTFSVHEVSSEFCK